MSQDTEQPQTQPTDEQIATTVNEAGAEAEKVLAKRGKKVKIARVTAKDVAKATKTQKPPRQSLEQSVGRQSVECLTSRRSKDESVRTALADARRLEDTGTLAESKLCKLRDVLRDLTPDEGEWAVRFAKARRGIGMVIARQET